MGCWNHTCAVSNLHVTAGQDVFVFLLLKNRRSDGSSFCYGNALYDVVPLPFYGKYDDYGGVDECHGFGIPIILDALKSRLYKFGQGPNEYHDCEVNKDNLDIEKLFEADHEGRLGIEDPGSWSDDEYSKGELERIQADKGLTESQQFELDRLAAKIKKVDTFRQVTHVVIHGNIARAILEKWYIEDYVGDGRGTTGYGNNYNHIYFKDVLNGIPEYVGKLKAQEEERAQLLAQGDNLNEVQMERLSRLLYRYDNDAWNSPNLATRYMSYFRSGSSNVWGLIDVQEHVDEYIKARDWAGLANFTREVLTASWINKFMGYTRKIWVKQTGQGSQSQEPVGYQILAQATLDILKAEQDEYDQINREVEEDEPAGV